MRRVSKGASAFAMSLVAGAVLVGCGGGSAAPPATTTTTVAPTTTTTTPPAVLGIDPVTAPVSAIITLSVTGAKPGESVTFTLTSPSGKVFTGSPHVVEPTGMTSATYNSTGDEVGAHTVKAMGTGGTALTGVLTLTRS